MSSMPLSQCATIFAHEPFLALRRECKQLNNVFDSPVVSCPHQGLLFVPKPLPREQGLAFYSLAFYSSSCSDLWSAVPEADADRIWQVVVPPRRMVRVLRVVLVQVDQMHEFGVERGGGSASHASVSSLPACSGLPGYRTRTRYLVNTVLLPAAVLVLLYR